LTRNLSALMCSGVLRCMILVKTDVSESISSLSLGFLRVKRLPISITVESLLISSPIDEYCVASNTVFWEPYYPEEP
jgi:hypothetical protein